jgi:hypothetical protein
MPHSILRIQALIAQESDPSSPFWIGQLEQGSYLPENLKLYQPGQIVPQETGLKEVVTAGDIKGVLTDQAVDGSKDVLGIQNGTYGLTIDSVEDVRLGLKAGTGAGTPGSITTVGVEMKQKVGVHWYETFPRNNNQEQILKIVRS